MTSANTRGSANMPIGPVTAKERVEFLDVLRGFALFGVLIANVVWYFSGYGDLDVNARSQLPTPVLDIIVLEIETYLFVNKFITIFTFLFGIGFAIQMQRASQQGPAAVKRFVRRLFWLLVFGILHTVFIWFGDILHLYALLGFILILWRSRNNKELIVWGLLFTLFVPVIIQTIIVALPAITGGSVDLTPGFDARWDYAIQLHQAFVEGSYVEMIRANLADFWAWFSTQDFLISGVSGFGMFLLGYWVGRTGILAQATSLKTDKRDESLILVQQGAKWGLIFGVIFNGLSWTGVLSSSELMGNVLGTFFWQLGVLGLACFYVCGLAILFRRKVWRGRLMLLAPVGRMALTNYLGQSLISILIFYGIGFGLYGKAGPTLTIPIAVLVFVFQMGISTWWLKRYNFGPAEWAWRSLTYWRLQKFKG